MNPSTISDRSILGRLLRAPLRLLPSRLDMPIWSGPAQGMKWRVGSSNHGCWLGSYEGDKVQALKELGFDDALNYKAPDFVKSFRAATKVSESVRRA